MMLYGFSGLNREGRRKREEGRRERKVYKEEGRRKKEEGRGKKEEGRRRKGKKGLQRFSFQQTIVGANGHSPLQGFGYEDVVYQSKKRCIREKLFINLVRVSI
ncbi:hypothetical protein [Okeania sp. SIO2B3]|uniref:hypothetical protein n=1 Tax=Okeania sp. SIO2B3 TaxID=2607784 RepID=UPI0013C0F02F|nr:hypothetical protein [Okeania sp. SIO2B3]NET41853.1 hypothetical protein [Okeania sp. SIO2B3]